MPKIQDIESTTKELADVPSLPWLSQAAKPGFIKGGLYLLAGEPGIGKTTLALQILGDMASQGMKVLYVTTEQSLGDVKTAVDRLFGDTADFARITENLYVDDTLDDIDGLPKFLARCVLTEGQEYHGCRAIAIDSLQGDGVGNH